MQNINEIQKYKSIATYAKNAWTDCHQQVIVLEDLLKKEQIKRREYAKIFKWIQILLASMIQVILISGIFIPILSVDIPNYVFSGIFGTTAAMFAGMWAKLETRAQKYLVKAEDCCKLEKICAETRRKLRAIIEDNVIDDQEYIQLREMIVNIHNYSNEISSMDLFFKLFFGKSSDDPVKYSIAYDGLSNIFDQINRSKKILENNAGKMIKEQQIVELNRELHSSYGVIA